MRKILMMLGGAFAFAFSAPATAQVTLQWDSTLTQITGATGVAVGSGIYSVEFVDGTCASVFSGCDDSSDFAFTTSGSALLAAQALLDQVFQGPWDALPQVALGCETTFPDSRCAIDIPYSAFSLSFGSLATDFAVATNGVLEANDQVSLNFEHDLFDTTNVSWVVWARFIQTGEATSAVTEPSTWAMMLGGFGVIGFQMRRRNRNKRASVLKLA